MLINIMCSCKHDNPKINCPCRNNPTFVIADVGPEDSCLTVRKKILETIVGQLKYHPSNHEDWNLIRHKGFGFRGASLPSTDDSFFLTFSLNADDNINVVINLGGCRGLVFSGNAIVNKSTSSLESEELESNELPIKNSLTKRLETYITARENIPHGYSPGFFWNTFIFKGQIQTQKANVHLAKKLLEKIQNGWFDPAEDLTTKGLKEIRDTFGESCRKRRCTSLNEIIHDLRKEYNVEKSKSSCFSFT